jgi:nanoRNase/pAp phosphatase (c-di-AMP/oligoRNAs hydrolase)
MMIALDPGVVAYRSVKEGIAVRPVAEMFGGKGHDKAATNPITEDFMNKFADILTTK